MTWSLSDSRHLGPGGFARGRVLSQAGTYLIGIAAEGIEFTGPAGGS